MEDTSIKLCDACHFIEKTAYAETFCRDCNQKLCKKCQVYHTKFSATRDHKLVSLEDMTQNMIEYTPSRPELSRCDYHERKDVRYYCYDHKEVYCSLCRIVKHANCKEKPIAEVCGTLGAQDLELLIKTLDKLAAGLDKSGKKRKTQIDDIETTKYKCIQEVLNLKQRLYRLIEQLNTNVEMKVAEVNERVEQFVDKTGVYDDARQHVVSLSDQIRQVLGCDDKEVIFTAQTKALKLKADYTMLIEQYKVDIAPLKLQFNQDEHIVDILSTVESLGEVNLECIESDKEASEQHADKVSGDKMIKNFPQVTARKVPARRLDKPGKKPLNPLSPHPVIARNWERATSLASQILEETRLESTTSDPTIPTKTTKVERGSFLNIRLKDTKTYPINQKDDNRAVDVTGLVFLDNGRLIICDNKNKSVKVIDSNFNISHSKRLSDHPWDVTDIDSSLIAVTLAKSKTVIFLTVSSDGVVIERSFQTKKMCWGIASYNDNLIITFHDNPGNGFVEIRSLKGEVMCKILDKDNEVATFASPFYVFLDWTTERFYVSDSGSFSVMCCEWNRSDLMVVNDLYLKCPKGIVLDCDGNMIVGTYLENQLKLLKTNGHDGYSKLCDVSMPQALSFDWKNLVLAVSTTGCKEITVLKFEYK